MHNQWHEKLSFIQWLCIDIRMIWHYLEGTVISAKNGIEKCKSMGFSMPAEYNQFRCNSKSHGFDRIIKTQS